MSRSKLLALVAIAVLTACSSSTDLIDKRTLGCDSGEDIEVRAGLASTMGLTEDGREDRFEMQIEVANNSHEDVTVTAIRVDQLSKDEATYAIDGGYREFDQVIEEGKDHTFTLPMSGRAVYRDPRTVISSSSRSGLSVAVTAVLSNGDSYRCEFDLSAR